MPTTCSKLSHGLESHILPAVRSPDFASGLRDGRQHGNTDSGLALRRADVDEESGADAGDRALAGNRNRREHRDLQRDERSPPETAALSTCGPARDSLVALARNRDTAGLAVARAIPRHQDAESCVRGNGDRARYKLHADRTHTGEESGRNRGVFEPTGYAGRQTIAGPYILAGGRQARET